MKKIISLSMLGLLTGGLMVNTPGKALAEEYPYIEPYYKMYSGFGLIDASDHTRSSFGSDSAFTAAAPTNTLREGTKRAIEYQPEDSYLLLGGKVETFFLPHRFYLDADIEGKDDWFGELRHSFKDIYLLRVMSRRFVHNLDNITLYDLNPSPTSNQVSRLDVGDDYGFAIDIDQFKMRLKTPNFPLHLYTEGELVRRDGDRQQLFLGGFTGFSPVRVSKSVDVNQETKTFTLGTNSHLNFLEVDFSHSWQDYGSDETDLHPYAANGVRAAGDYVHNRLPDLQAHKNSLKVHTTHTGEVVATATLMDINRENVTDDQDVEADKRLAHADFMWTPRVNLSLGTKFRHQENSSGGADSLVSPYNGDLIPTPQGVEGFTNKYTAFVRYTPVNRLTLKGQYSIEHMERDRESALAWFRAEEMDIDTLEIGASWRARRDLKVNGKYIHKDVDVDRGDVLHIFNNDPEKTEQLTADATYFPTARTSFLISALFKEETADDLESLETFFQPFEPVVVAGNKADDYDALWQRYLASVTHACTERFSVTAAYVYSVTDTDRDFGIGSEIDPGYSNKQAYHTVSLSNSFQATERLNLEALIDYTVATGEYSLTEADLLIGAPPAIEDISMTDTKELGVRLEGEQELGQGWTAGVILRYVDFIDKSFDNPADGNMYGALLKMTKVFQ